MVPHILDAWLVIIATVFGRIRDLMESSSIEPVTSQGIISKVMPLSSSCVSGLITALCSIELTST